MNNKKDWNQNIITKIVPQINTDDVVYLSEEIPDKTDYFYKKLIPNERCRLETKEGTFTLLKQTGKRIHSDDFGSTIMIKSEHKGFNIYIIDKYDARIDKNTVMPKRVSGLFNGEKWIEPFLDQTPL